VQYYLDDVDDIDDEDTDEDDGKADDDDRAYKNPRKLPSSECPRNEDQAAFMVLFILYNAKQYLHIFKYRFLYQYLLFGKLIRLYFYGT